MGHRPETAVCLKVGDTPIDGHGKIGKMMITTLTLKETHPNGVTQSKTQLQSRKNGGLCHEQLEFHRIETSNMGTSGYMWIKMMQHKHNQLQPEALQRFWVAINR